MPQFPKDTAVSHAFIHTKPVNTGKRRRITKKKLSRLEKIPSKPLELQTAPDCAHCGAKRFHLESPKFCCFGGEVSLFILAMPYEFSRFYTGFDETTLFFDTEEELSVRLDASPKLRESTMKLLMNFLGENPYAKFFKGVRDIPNIEEKTTVLNSNPGLD
ncbi:hypothetical protein ACH5RR_012288 [Cinchona calisaya]|uniref:Uncharacterized protein n=1 Tax=Cinchona calisaya TaxID=153742 RepID=A0ABD3A9Y0_9GENT